MGDETYEQSLVIDTDKGLIVITGCAHGGIVEIAKKAQTMLGKKIALLIGGFHLMYKDEAGIKQAVDELLTMDIDFVCPTHCSGDMAIDRFKHAFAKRFIAGGAGKTVQSTLEKA
jgi:7,8-dihydropterin-6-yl-methyl-4-(beta-D-ribofuranosyl)aminobenzene 5'-phosphate synthase